MKKLIMLVCVLGLLAIGVTAIAGNLDYDMSRCERETGTGFLTCEGTLFNNSNKDLRYCEVSVLLLNNGKIIASESRPYVDIPSGSFSTKTMYFGKGIRDHTHYRWSVVKIKFH